MKLDANEGWIRLAAWGRQFGLHEQSTWRMYRDGRLPDGLEVRRVGHIYYVREQDTRPPPSRNIIYARVSSTSRSESLIKQAERLQKYAAKQELEIDEVVMEIGSGLNNKRPKLLRVLSHEGPLCILVEHRDRLTRFGFEYLERVLSTHGGRIVVADNTEVEDDLVRDVTEVLTSMCARLYGKRSAKIRAERAMAAAGGSEHG